MNIYVPEAYFKGEIINGYSAQNAPIFFPNRIGGYMPATPTTALNNGPGGFPGGGMPGGGLNIGGGPGGRRESAVIVALSKGYVVASAGHGAELSPLEKHPPTWLI